MSTPNPDRARALVTASLGAVVFFALVIVGFGALSYATRTDPIGEPGLGPLPGVLGVVLSAAGWLAVVLPSAPRRPGAGMAVSAGVVAAAVHLLAVFVGVLPSGFATAGAVVAHLVTAWYALVVLAAGVLAAVGVAVMLRVGGATAKWPWEHDDDE